MKKLFFVIAAIFATTVISAQDSCMGFFPDRIGAVMISKSYDGHNNELATMTSTISDSQNSPIGKVIRLSFNMTDIQGTQIDRGEITARCDNGYFYLDMTNRVMLPGVAPILSQETELLGDFLDYPNYFDDSNFPTLDSRFIMDEGTFTVKRRGSGDDMMKVRVFNREYVENDRITTPAGEFESAKITFGVEVIENGTSTYYRGVEWYAPGAGIVKTEIYNQNHQLENYTVLTSLSDYPDNRL